MSSRMSQKCGSSEVNTFVIQIGIISIRVLSDKIKACAETRVGNWGRVEVWIKAKETGCKLFSIKACSK